MATSTGSFFSGYIKGTADAGKTILGLQDKFEAAQEMVSNLKEKVDANAAELTNAIAKLAIQEDIIKKYQAKEQTDENRDGLKI